jgi:hypothetical protein
LADVDAVIARENAVEAPVPSADIQRGVGRPAKSSSARPAVAARVPNNSISFSMEEARNKLSTATKPKVKREPGGRKSVGRSKKSTVASHAASVVDDSGLSDVDESSDRHSHEDDSGDILSSISTSSANSNSNSIVTSRPTREDDDLADLSGDDFDTLALSTEPQDAVNVSADDIDDWLVDTSPKSDTGDAQSGGWDNFDLDEPAADESVTNTGASDIPIEDTEWDE